MIIIQGTTSTAAIGGNVVKELAKSTMSDVVQTVTAPQVEDVSLKVMRAFLSARGVREDVVFIDTVPDPSTESFLSDNQDQIRTVTVLGSMKYLPKTRAFDRLCQSGVIGLKTPVNDAATFVQQLDVLFADPKQVRRVFNRQVEQAKTVLARTKEAMAS